MASQADAAGSEAAKRLPPLPVGQPGSTDPSALRGASSAPPERDASGGASARAAGAAAAAGPSGIELSEGGAITGGELDSWRIGAAPAVASGGAASAEGAAPRGLRVSLEHMPRTEALRAVAAEGAVPRSPLDGGASSGDAAARSREITFSTSALCSETATAAAKAEKAKEEKLKELLVWVKKRGPVPHFAWGEIDEDMDGRREGAVEAIGALFGRYVPVRWYWKLCELLYRFLITSVLLFIAPGSLSQGAATPPPAVWGAPGSGAAKDVRAEVLDERCPRPRAKAIFHSFHRNSCCSCCRPLHLVPGAPVVPAPSALRGSHHPAGGLLRCGHISRLRDDVRQIVAARRNKRMLTNPTPPQSSTHDAAQDISSFTVSSSSPCSSRLSECCAAAAQTSFGHLFCARNNMGIHGNNLVAAALINNSPVSGCPSVLGAKITYSCRDSWGCLQLRSSLCLACRCATHRPSPITSHCIYHRGLYIASCEMAPWAVLP